MRKNAGRLGFRVETSDGMIEANNVVAATGPFQRPIIPPLFPRMQASIRSIPAPTAIPTNCPRVRCWWSVRDPRGCRSRTSFCMQESESISRSARTIVLPGPIAGVTSAGGWGFSASGMPKRRGLARSMSRSP